LRPPLFLPRMWTPFFRWAQPLQACVDGDDRWTALCRICILGICAQHISILRNLLIHRTEEQYKKRSMSTKPYLIVFIVTLAVIVVSADTGLCFALPTITKSGFFK
jgi:hypothetical protein